MKRLLTIFTLIVSVLSCTNEVDVSYEEMSKERVKFTASKVDGSQTKATLINTWSGKEEVALFVDEVLYHYSIAADGSMTGDDIIVDREQEITYTSFYPYDPELKTMEEYESACKEGNVDYMKATTTTTGEAVSLQFSHSLAALSFTIWTEGKVSAPVVSLALDGNFDNTVELEVEVANISSIVSKFEYNYFLENSTDISLAFIKVEQNGSISFHSIKRNDSNILEASKQYLFSYSIGDVELGSGTEKDPFVVYFADDMRKVGSGKDGWNMDSNYRLGQDIDLGGIDEDGNGVAENEFTVIATGDKTFTGTFDGSGYVINGLYINKPGLGMIGLFGWINGATIKNLGVCGIVISGACGGGVVGFAFNSSSIIDCYKDGRVLGSSEIGGVVGSADNSTTVSGCYNNGSVYGEVNVGGVVGSASQSVSECYNTGFVYGDNQVGGVVGIASQSVSECYNTGFVYGDNQVGGVVGIAYSSVRECYNRGAVEGSDCLVGGVVGYTDSMVNYSYYDKDVVTGVAGAVAGKDDGTNYRALMTEQMKGGATSEGSLLYYFAQGGSTAWVADDVENPINDGYPVLKWQIANK